MDNWWAMTNVKWQRRPLDEEGNEGVNTALKKMAIISTGKYQLWAWWVEAQIYKVLGVQQEKDPLPPKKLL